MIQVSIKLVKIYSELGHKSLFAGRYYVGAHLLSKILNIMTFTTKLPLFITLGYYVQIIETE